MAGEGAAIAGVVNVISKLVESGTEIATAAINSNTTQAQQTQQAQPPQETHHDDENDEAVARAESYDASRTLGEDRDRLQELFRRYTPRRST